MKRFKSLLTLPLALACAAFTFSLAVCAQAQTVTAIANFNSQVAYGPVAPIQATDGNFYGIAAGGVHGQGVIYQMTPSGSLSYLYSFCSQPKCADGNNGTASPILGSDGNLYGVTSFGGSHGSGTIYKLTLGGTITILYNFCPPTSCSEGTNSYGLMEGGDGNFYGTTFQGGDFDLGTIFRISPSGDFRVLYNFCSLANCADGILPQSPPIQGIDGNFYGVVIGGGSMQGGALYKLTPSGSYSVVRNFCTYANGLCNGAQPESIVQDASGNFFGVAEFAGAKGYGAVFEITTTHQYKALRSFDRDTGYPLPGLTLGNDGNVYGKTEGSPSSLNFGTLFEVTPAGVYTRVYTFGSDCLVGDTPWWGSLFQGTDGILYGANIYGGGSGCNDGGTVFGLDNSLSPLVRTAPTAGKVGRSVLIIGNGLTGSTSVTFNGMAAAFTVESDTYIKATVPAGATTGTVSVVTPSGTLKSNPQFVVTR
jgi:uncharacterized repeat protein (TIGR03803 family)